MKKTVMLAFIILLSACDLMASQDQPNEPVKSQGPSSFYQAKKNLRNIYRQKTKTFYCGCQFHYQGNTLVLNHSSCGYQTRHNQARANRIE